MSSTQKKIRLLREYVGRHPMWVAWQVTYRCNFRCGFCGYWHDEQGKQPEQTVEQFEYGARQMARLGSVFVSLAGGEPLLRDDIVALVEVIARWHLPFVTTNGYLMTPELARELYEAGAWGVSVSIDYANAEQHDRRRGMKGAFDRAVRALEYLAKGRKYAWQRVNLMSVLMHDNLDQMEELIKIARGCGAYFMVQPYSAMKTGDERFVCRDPQVSEKLLELRGRYPNMLSNPYFLSQFRNAVTQGVGGCMAGRAFYNIDSLGNVSICVERRSVPVGNLYEDNIVLLYRKMREEAKGNTCKSCWYNCRGELESLYHPYGLFRSLPTYFFDRGQVPEEMPVW
ncbi:MAG: radical SAM protein [Phycisphaerae bacterium]|nr:radical SAM protein [Phycisphaerae bacterium]